MDEHVVEASEANPEDCTPEHSCVRPSRPGIPTARDAGMRRVPHGDHVDYLVADHLHHPHGDHCDDHGRLQAA